MKKKRFIKEYAHFVMKRLHDATYDSYEELWELEEKLSRICKHYEKGYTSETETMRRLSELDFGIGVIA